MLAGVQGTDCPFCVQTIGQWIIDRVDLGVCEQSAVGWMNARNVMFAGERPGVLRVTCRDP